MPHNNDHHQERGETRVQVPKWCQVVEEFENVKVSGEWALNEGSAAEGWVLCMACVPMQGIQELMGESLHAALSPLLSMRRSIETAQPCGIDSKRIMQ